MQAHSSTTVGTLILSSLGLSLIGYAIVWFFVPIALIDIAAAVALALLPFGLLSFKRSRRINAFNAVLAESIDMLARALRAGHSVIGALEILTQNVQEPAASEFGEVFKQQNIGMPLRDALMQLLDRVPSADLRVLVTAILVQKDTGGNLAEILDRTVRCHSRPAANSGRDPRPYSPGKAHRMDSQRAPVVMLFAHQHREPGILQHSSPRSHGPQADLCSIGYAVARTFTIHRIVNGIEV